MKRLLLAATLSVGLAASFVPFANAQVSGIALAETTQGNPLDGFFGPFRPCGGSNSNPSCGAFEGTSISYIVLCFDTISREKRMAHVIANIPDGTSLAQLRVLATTAVVNGCAAQNITVPRGAVILPDIILGQ